MNPHYQATIARAFVDFLDQGYVYKGLKPVNWCINDRTALAEAEVEYENHSSPSIYVRFRLISDPAAIDPALAGRNVYGVIWTTTPWTMPANLAIAYHPKFEYVAIDVSGDVYIVARDLLQACTDNIGWEWENIRRNLLRRQARRNRLSDIRSSTASQKAFSGITSHWSRELVRCIQRPVTDMKIMLSA